MLLTVERVVHILVEDVAVAQQIAPPIVVKDVIEVAIAVVVHVIMGVEDGVFMVVHRVLATVTVVPEIVMLMAVPINAVTAKVTVLAVVLVLPPQVEQNYILSLKNSEFKTS